MFLREEGVFFVRYLFRLIDLGLYSLFVKGIHYVLRLTTHPHHLDSQDVAELWEFPPMGGFLSHQGWFRRTVLSLGRPFGPTDEVSRSTFVNSCYYYRDLLNVGKREDVATSI